MYLPVVRDTALIGLAVSIAFQHITANFRASISLSLQRPFEPADLVKLTN
jgi:small-conductance mechanosensitive channel